MEDNAADVFLIRAAIKAADIPANIHVVRDGEQAFRFFDQADAEFARPCPDVVILDINLPKRQGGEVLTHIRKSQRCSQAIVIVVSTSESTQDRDEMAKLGSNGYFRKPSDYVGFMKLGELIQELLKD